MYESQAEIDEFFRCLFQFRSVKKLGEGAFGLAILVFDEVEQIHKVFKLPKDKHTTEALRKEGANLVKLSELLHPNIIRLHQFGKVRMTWNGVEEDRYYINMAFGGSSLRNSLGKLRKELDENGNERLFGGGRRLAPELAVRIAVDVCNGLEAAHGFRGARIRMLHRDIKPDNILIDDNTGIARLGDFGLSRVIARSSSQVSGAGTYLYMDPECFHGRATVTSDLYSLAFVIYEMVTGELPFHDFRERFDNPPKPPTEIVPDLPHEFDQITLRGMSNDLTERYPDASAMLTDLRRLAAKLNPMPARFTRLSELPGGRSLCQDEETGERVAIRLINSSAALAEFAVQCNRLEEIRATGVEIPLRHFANEQFIGIVSRPPSTDDLKQHFGARALAAVDGLQDFCAIISKVCDIVAVFHREGLVHGMLSPYAITVGADGPQIHEFGSSPILRARKAHARADESLESLGPLLPFMSPQLLAASHDPSPADDIYALSAIMYFLLTNHPAVDQEDRHRLMLGGSVAEPSYNIRAHNILVPPGLAATISKGLRFSPHDRFESVAQLAERIRSCKWPDDTLSALVDEALEVFPVGGSPRQLLKACDLLKLALQIQPGSPEAHRARGEVYFRDKSYRYAIEELTKAALVLPDKDTLSLLGQAYENQGAEPAKAVGAYERALQYGDDPMLLERLARLLWKLERPKRAAGVLQRAIDCEHDSSLRERRRLLLQQWQAASQALAAKSQPEQESPAEHLPLDHLGTTLVRGDVTTNPEPEESTANVDDPPLADGEPERNDRTSSS